MHRCKLLSLGFVLLLPIVAPARGGIIDFEELPFDQDPFYNGSDGAGGFVSGGASFNNLFTDYGDGFTSWEGWAYSKTTDATTPGYFNQYSAVTGGGYDGSTNYAVAFTQTYVLPGSIITLPAGMLPISVQVTNTTYAYRATIDPTPPGAQFPSEFHTGDTLTLLVTGLDVDGHSTGQSQSFALADYTSADESQHKIVTTWQNVNLSGLAGAAALEFAIVSTNIYTPAYVAIDDLNLTEQFGDVNYDGIVSLTDLTSVASHWQASGPVGDANGDGIVSLTDLTAIASNWNAGQDHGEMLRQGPSLNGIGVPEPGSASLLLLGLAGLFAWAYCPWKMPSRPFST